MTFKVGNSISWSQRAQSKEAQAKRKKTLSATMTKKKQEKRREKGAWYCQNPNCGEKHYAGEPKYFICQKCFDKLRGVK